jgi:predicted SAM-dependent methyltransferase
MHEIPLLFSTCSCIPIPSAEGIVAQTELICFYLQMGLKTRLGRLILPRLPVSRHVFDHVRMELNAFHARVALRIYPSRFIKRSQLKRQKNLLVNIGCGPFGLPGWINFDLYALKSVTLPVDCRLSIPLGAKSCRGIHVEHYLEHLEPGKELPAFLAECRRCLAPEGVLRIIVPDAAKFVKAYQSPGWDELNTLIYDDECSEHTFRSKMDALNHVFLQNGEHYGGFDEERLQEVLKQSGFSRVQRREWRQGEFPGGCIDRELHRNNSLYFEAR